MRQQKKEEKKTTLSTREPRDNQGESVNRSRRKALQTIAAGTAAAGALALTGKWSKPLVDTIILPAHAQATNAQEPTNTTTTPTPTTTSGACSPNIEAACYTVIRDTQTERITSATVTGSVSPASPGVAITIQIISIQGEGSQRTDTLNTTTNGTGTFSATQTYRVSDVVTDIEMASASGPCNSVEAPQCS